MTCLGTDERRVAGARPPGENHLGNPAQRANQRVSGWLRSRSPDSLSKTWYRLKVSRT